MPVDNTLERLFAANPELNFGLFQYSSKTKQLFCSSGIYKLFGWIESTTIPNIELLKENLGSEYFNQIKSLLEKSLTTQHEFSFTFLLKEKRIKCLISYFKKNENNEIIYSGLLQDITYSFSKNKEDENTIIQLHKIVNSSPDIICTINKNGKLLTVNSASIHVLGYEPEEMIGKKYTEFVIKEDHSASIQAFNTFMNGENITNFENRYLAKSGEIIPIIWSAHWDNSDEKMYCVGKDGREIKKQEALRIKNEKRYHALVNNASDAILIINKEGQSIYSSPSIFKLTGYTEEAIKGLKLIDSIHPKDIPVLLKYYQVAIEKPGEVIFAEHIRFKHANDEWIIVEFSLTNLLQDIDLEGIVINFRDISDKEKAFRELKLMESVITHTSDAIIITEAEPFDLPGPKIIFVNDAFTQMTGYTKEEVIGKTPRILQGPKTDRRELASLSEAIRNWQHYETTLINYKKDGEPFWINFSITPIADEKGWYTHWIAVERNVTETKKLELEKILLAEISNIFLQESTLEEILTTSLNKIITSEEFSIGEIWLLNVNSESLQLIAFAGADENITGFYSDNHNYNFINTHLGLAGHVWENKELTYWEDLSNHPKFIRKEQAVKYQINGMYGIPLMNGNQVIGVICLGLTDTKKLKSVSTNLFQQLSNMLAAEIIRKKLTIELNKIFNSSGDLIIIAGLDGNIKKSSPAVIDILEYSPAEIVNLPFTDFIHPDDEEITRKQAEKLSKGEAIPYFENRLITKNKNVKWMAWTFTPSNEDNLIYGIGKDITEKKNLEDILNKSNRLAKIGSWEINMNKGTVYWSEITKEIREVEPDFIPTLELGISKFKEGTHRNKIQELLQNCIDNGTPWDEELLIETFKGNWKWVRTIGEGELLNGKCIRVYGSFQDINEKKIAQQKLMESNERFNLVAKATNDLIWDWDITTGDTIRLGKTFFENLGYHENFTKTNKALWLNFIHPDDLERVESERNKVFADPTKTYWEDQYRCKRADGTYAYVYDRGYIVRTSNGKVLKMIGSTQDISKLKQNELELSEAKKRYSELFHLSPLPMWVYDIETLEFLDVNDSAVKHYGYSKEEFKRLTLRDIRPKQDLPAFEEQLKIAKKTPTEFMSGVFRHIKKNGEIIDVDVQSNYIQYKGRNARVILVNDITDRLEYISAIETKNKELQDIAWLQSHVMRAPVAKIMGIVHLLQRLDLDEVEKSILLNDLNTCASELDKVIHDIANKTHHARLK